MNTALMVDHLRRPKKARSVYTVLRFERKSGAFQGIEGFYSINAKAEHAVAMCDDDRYKHEIVKGHVI
jgi:hypothetical protein